MQYTVTVCHDASARVWYVRSSDLVGLHAEAPTLDDLIEAIEDVYLDLLPVPSADPSQIRLCVQHFVTGRRRRAA